MGKIWQKGDSPLLALKMEEQGDKKYNISRMAESGPLVTADQGTGTSVLQLQGTEFCDHQNELGQTWAPDENTAQMTPRFSLGRLWAKSCSSQMPDTQKLWDDKWVLFKVLNLWQCVTQCEKWIHTLNGLKASYPRPKSKLLRTETYQPLWIRSIRQAPCCSKYDPWTNCIHIARELVRNVASQTPARSTESKSSFFTNPLWLICILKCEGHWLAF